MLVLNRKPGQRVHIGAFVVLTVVGVENGRVRLAFDAPPQVSIDRDEVRQRRSGNARNDADCEVQGKLAIPE
jgi:carbon storage regulator